MRRKYIIILGESVGSLEALVNREIFGGYEPVGGVTITLQGNYIQAMILKN